MSVKIIQLFLFLLLSRPSLAVAGDKAYVISGFDDVLRQAELTSWVKAATRLFEKDKTFSAMPELYQTLSDGEPDPKFLLISGISTWFEKRVADFLADSKYPSNQLYLRSWLTEWSIEKFKIEKIRTILAQNPTRKVIVILDNSHPSIALAESLRKDFSGKVLAVYLRQVEKKALSAGSYPYFTAFDIALAENQADRMSLSEVKTVADAVLKESRVGMLFPPYALCPVDYDPCQGAGQKLNEVCAAVRYHVRDLCRDR